MNVEDRSLKGLTALFERSLRPMLAFDDARRVVDANRAACLLFRQSREALLARRVDDLVAAQAGRYELRGGDAAGVEVQYTPNVRPGVHLSVLTFPGEADPPPDGPRSDRALTAREREVMSLLAMGLDGPQIAHELSISATTVQTHVRNAMGRLGAKTRVHAVALAIVAGEIAV